MPSLLFEGSDSLKVSIADTKNKTVSFSMDNNMPYVENSILEIPLPLSDLIVLSDWLQNQIRAIQSKEAIND